MEATPNTETFYIINVNDPHANLGSLPLLEQHLRSWEHHFPGHVLKLLSGDFIQGTLEAELTRGSTALHEYLKLPWDAIALGNHEFDFNREQVETLLIQAKAPVLWSGSPVFDSRLKTMAMVDRSGVRFALFGVPTAQTPRTTKGDVSGIDFSFHPDTFASVVKDAEGSFHPHVRVVLFHAGMTCRSRPSMFMSARYQLLLDAEQDCDPAGELYTRLEQLRTSAIDVVAAAHTHTFLSHHFQHRMAIQQTQGMGLSYSVIALRVHMPTRHILSSETQSFGPVFLDHGAPFALLPLDEAFIQNLSKQLDQTSEMRHRVLGESPTTLVHDAIQQTSSMAVFLSTQLAKEIPTDVVLLNFNGIRVPFSQGAITEETLFDALPYESELVILDVPVSEWSHFSKQSKALRSAGAIITPIHLRSRKFVRILTQKFLLQGGDGFDAIIPSHWISLTKSSDPLTHLNTRDTVRRALLRHE